MVMTVVIMIMISNDKYDDKTDNGNKNDNESKNNNNKYSYNNTS